MTKISWFMEFPQRVFEVNTFHLTKTPFLLQKICGILHFSHLWEVVLFWEIFLPSLGLALFFGSKCCRKSKNDSTSWVWLYCVIHANLSVWIWFAYFIFTYNYCWQEIASYSCPDCSTVACTGGIFLGNES